MKNVVAKNKRAKTETYRWHVYQKFEQALRECEKNTELSQNEMSGDCMWAQDVEK